MWWRRWWCGGGGLAVSRPSFLFSRAGRAFESNGSKSLGFIDLRGKSTGKARGRRYLAAHLILAPIISRVDLAAIALLLTFSTQPLISLLHHVLDQIRVRQRCQHLLSRRASVPSKFWFACMIFMFDDDVGGTFERQVGDSLLSLRIRYRTVILTYFVVSRSNMPSKPSSSDPQQSVFKPRTERYWLSRSV